MAFLREQPGKDGRETPKFEAVDEHGAILAVGHLEIELIPGATRHGDVSFITVEPTGKPRSAFGGFGS